MSDISKNAPQTPSDPSRDRPLQPNSSISLKLRELYGSVEEQAIPDRLLDLLKRLEQAEQNATSVVPE
jgi:hypothetical protein